MTTVAGVWTAKQRIADEIECSKQTVITTVKAMLADKSHQSSPGIAQTATVTRSNTHIDLAP
jgi:hypothetical protein